MNWQMILSLFVLLFFTSSCGEFKEVFGLNKAESSYSAEKKSKVSKKSKKNKKSKKSKKTQKKSSSVSHSSSEKKGKYIWPVQGKVTSGMGMRNGRPHDGIDISAPGGTPVKAARSGVVIYTGRMKGYGNIVIIKHDKDYFTAYAHLSKIQTRKNKKINHSLPLFYKFCRTMIGPAIFEN